MADILRVTAPLVNKNMIPQQKPTADPTLPFSLSDVQVVPKTPAQSELLGQSNTLNKEEGAALLMGMMKDPAVTVQFLTSFFMLEEVVGLLPLNNSPITEEINQLFSAMLLDPSQIEGELLQQEFSSTSFKGALFDFLRGLLKSQPQLASSVELAGLLKSLSSSLSREDVLSSLSNGMFFLSQTMAPSQSLSQKLSGISLLLAQPDAAKNFPLLKQEILALLKEVQGSILFSPRVEKTISIITYNLSRFQDNSELIRESLDNLLSMVNGGGQKEQLSRLVTGYMLSNLTSTPESDRSFLLKILAELLPGDRSTAANAMETLLRNPISHDAQQIPPDEKLKAMLLLIKDGTATPVIKTMAQQLVMSMALTQRASEGASPRSHVMNLLADIMVKEGDSLSALAPDKTDRIIHSLLSSPSNFTPLLHFVIPVKQEDLRSFAEFWIDPNDYDDSPKNGKPQAGTHVLVTFDISGIGKFEVELWAQNQRLNLTLLCPEQYVSQYSQVTAKVTKAASSFGYTFDKITVDKLVRGRSLIEVFKTLPYKRMGVNVKV